MKKIVLSLIAVGVLSGVAFADLFDNLSNISPEQMEQLTQIHNTYKQKTDDMENKIMEYTDKLTKIQLSNDITAEQKALLSSAYERNLMVLQVQLDQLKSNADAAYKQILTDEQYKEYSAQQIRVENAFSDFLKK
ncbi:hypothetical protein II906_00770 [bacterium]|nr:hypothetical protein [bacterium]